MILDEASSRLRVLGNDQASIDDSLVCTSQRLADIPVEMAREILKSGPAGMSAATLLAITSKAYKAPEKHPNFFPHSKKQVRFAQNDEGQVDAKVHYVERIQVNDRRELWWTKEDRVETRMHCAAVIQEYARDEEYVDALKLMFQSFDSDSTSDEDLDDACQMLAICWEMRGLEKQVTNVLQEVTKRHRSTIFDAEQTLKGPSYIRKQSRPLSRIGRNFAKSMANVDAQEAAVTYFCDSG